MRIKPKFWKWLLTNFETFAKRNDNNVVAAKHCPGSSGAFFIGSTEADKRLNPQQLADSMAHASGYGDQ